MEVKGAVIRWGLGQPLPAPFDTLPRSRFVAHGGFLYFTATPVGGDPWLAFETEFGPPPLPIGFVSIFGVEPTPDGSFATESLRSFWRQQLGLWRDAKTPEWLTPEQEAAGRIIWANYTGLTQMQFFRLTNGANRVVFPESDTRTASEQLPQRFQLPAEVVFIWAGEGMAVYQLLQKANGIIVPEDKLVPFLKNKGGVHTG